MQYLTYCQYSLIFTLSFINHRNPFYSSLLVTATTYQIRTKHYYLDFKDMVFILFFIYLSL